MTFDETVYYMFGSALFIFVFTLLILHSVPLSLVFGLMTGGVVAIIGVLFKKY